MNTNSASSKMMMDLGRFFNSNGNFMIILINTLVLLISVILFIIFVLIRIIKVQPHVFSPVSIMAFFLFLSFFIIIWRGLAIIACRYNKKADIFKHILHGIVFLITGTFVSIIPFNDFEYSWFYLVYTAFLLYCIPIAFFHSIKFLLFKTSNLLSTFLLYFFSVISVFLLSLSTFSFIRFSTREETERYDLLFTCIPFGFISAVIIFFKIFTFFRRARCTEKKVFSS